MKDQFSFQPCVRAFQLFFFLAKKSQAGLKSAEFSELDAMRRMKGAQKERCLAYVKADAMLCSNLHSR